MGGGTFAVIGAVVGGALGALELGPKLGGDDETSSFGSRLAGGAIGVIVGGGIGLGIGNLASSLPIVATSAVGSAAGLIYARKKQAKA